MISLKLLFDVLQKDSFLSKKKGLVEIELGS